MRRITKSLISVIVLGLSSAVVAQSINYNLGRIPTDEEIQGWVTPIPPTGKGLPPGKGNAEQGAVIYAQNCMFCHGPNGDGTIGKFPPLKGTLRLPYATTIWDYINRAMPRRVTNPGVRERQLSADEAYALTAYILHLNGVIGENDILNANSLPKVKIPIQTIK